MWRPADDGRRSGSPFNSAPASSPRRCDPWDAEATWEKCLQFGPGVVAEEMSRPAAGGPRAARLQFGPGVVAEEMYDVPAARTLRKGASIRPRRRRRGDVSSPTPTADAPLFPASIRPRRRRRGDVRDRRQDGGELPHASIRPRRRRRGDVATPCEVRWRSTWLQFGPGVVAEEMCRVASAAP